MEKEEHLKKIKYRYKYGELFNTGQRNTHKWFEVRKDHLTAWNFHEACFFRPETDTANKVDENNRCRRRGKENEPIAKKSWRSTLHQSEIVK